MNTAFSHFNLPLALINSLKFIKFTEATEIQAKAIPEILANSDILASSQTGSGKTGAFLIPIIAKLIENPFTAKLVLVPTRELAIQISGLAKQLLFKTNVNFAMLIGGESIGRQFRQLDYKPRLIIGTPGRVKDHLLRASLDLSQCDLVTLDEADRMMDMGFGPQIEEIFEYLPQVRQTLMFSATIQPEIERMSRRYLKNPARICVGSNEVKPVNIPQKFVHANERDKMKLLLEELQSRSGSTIIFANTKYKVDAIQGFLLQEGYRAKAIHGGLKQEQRERVMNSFRKGMIDVLVGTDVVARGVDVSHIENVVNFDIPDLYDDYVHRIGRTGRKSGVAGSAVSFISPQDKFRWQIIERNLKKFKQAA
jgi:superfamily II DNA/RNA helicase